MLLITNKGQDKFRDSVTTIPVGMLYKYKTLNGINILISWKGKAVVHSMGNSVDVSMACATELSLQLLSV